MRVKIFLIAHLVDARRSAVPVVIDALLEAIRVRARRFPAAVTHRILQIVWRGSSKH